MQLNKEEFKTLVMLYAANIDGNIHPEEVEVMLEKADVSTFKKVSKLFKKMGDNEVLECIRANKDRFAATVDDKEQLLNSFRSVIQADERCTAYSGINVPLVAVSNVPLVAVSNVPLVAVSNVPVVAE